MRGAILYQTPLKETTMKKKAVLALLLAGGVLCAPFAQAQPTLAEIDKGVREAFAKLNSFSGVLKLDGMISLAPPGPAGSPPAPKIPITGGGSIDYLKAGDKTMYRQVLDGKVLTIAGGIEAVFDGEKFHLKTNISGTQKVEVTEPSIEKGLVPPGGASLLDEVQKHLDLTPKADATINGRPAYVLEGKMKAGQKFDLPVASATIFLDKETGALSQLDFLGTDPTNKITLAVNDIKVNPEIKPDLFAPPVAAVKTAPAAAPGAAPAPAPAAK